MIKHFKHLLCISGNRSHAECGLGNDLFGVLDAILHCAAEVGRRQLSSRTLLCVYVSVSQTDACQHRQSTIRLTVSGP